MFPEGSEALHHETDLLFAYATTVTCRTPQRIYPREVESWRCELDFCERRWDKAERDSIQVEGGKGEDRESLMNRWRWMEDGWEIVCSYFNLRPFGCVC
jgi:hypothetical protein